MNKDINRWTPEKELNEEGFMLDYTVTNIKNIKLPILSNSQTVPKIKKNFISLNKNTSFCARQRSSIGAIRIPTVYDYKTDTLPGTNKKATKNTLKLKQVNIMPFSANGTLKKKNIVIRKKFVSISGSFFLHNSK